MAADSVELLVVGGGPAGLATAVRARLEGLDTVLIDPGRPPIERACGEGLMPDGARRLQELGVVLPADRLSQFYGIRYHDGDTVAEGSFSEGAGVGVRRVDLHAALCRRAEDTGVGLRWGVRATGLEATGVQTDDGPIRAEWIVAADGRSSRIRRWSGLEGRAPRHTRFGVRRHYRVPPWTECVEVYWSDRAEAYVTPLGRSTVGVAMLARSSPTAPSRAGAERAVFDRLLEHFPALRRRLEGAPVESRDLGAGGFGHRPKAVAQDRLALVGDASGSLDPITGEGLAAAFHQGFAVVEAIVRRDLAGYAREHRRIVRVPRLLTGLLVAAERRPWLRRRLIRLLAARPGLFDELLAVRARGSLGGRGFLALAGKLAGHGA